MIIVIKYIGGLLKTNITIVKYWLEVETIALDTKKWGKTALKLLNLFVSIQVF